MSKRLPATGVVLAGGHSRRMGEDKALLELDGQLLIQWVIQRVARVCAEVLVVTGEADRYAGLGAPVVTDRFPGVGVLGGLHAGLDAASHELILAVGCDMPFLNPDLLRAFVDWVEGWDVAVLRRGEWVDPLHAAYRRTCLPALEAVIEAGRRRVISFFPQVRVRYVTEAEVAAIDPELESFRNVNTPADWRMTLDDWESL
ncbi:MAG: molybdenum cofactor guanylyltransferase [Anaerolineae bacterium]